MDERFRLSPTSEKRTPRPEPCRWAQQHNALALDPPLGIQKIIPSGKFDVFFYFNLIEKENGEWKFCLTSGDFFSYR